MTDSDLTLWDFVVHIYSKPDVESACLYLQDRHGINVSLLLFCCWTGVYYGAVSKEQLQQAREFSDSWSSQTTDILRQLRRDMKHNYKPHWPMPESGWQSFRSKVKGLELESERMQLSSLEELMKDLVPQAPSEQQSIAHHCQANIANGYPDIMAMMTEEDNHQLDQIIKAIVY